MNVDSVIKTGLILIVMAISLLAIYVMAKPANAKGFYLEGYGGPNWSTDFGGSGGGGDWQFNADPDTGYVIGGKLGTEIDSLPGFSIEADLSYRRNNLTGAWGYFVPDGPCCVEAKYLVPVEGEWVTYPFQGSDSTFALMANAKYEYYLATELEVHALAGVGYASRHLELVSQTHPNLDTDEGGFAWQAGVGASYEVAKGVKLGVDYIYFQGPSITRTVDLWDTPVTFNADGQNQAVTASLTFELE